MSTAYSRPQPAAAPREAQTPHDDDPVRSQLAMLLYVALSHLRAKPGSHPARVLFALLPQLARFDVAFIVEERTTAQRGTKPWFTVHPKSERLREADCRKAIADCDGALATDNIAGLGLQAARRTLRSRAIVPVGRGQLLVLLSSAPRAYDSQQDFLGLLGEVYEAALTNAGESAAPNSAKARSSSSR